MQAADPAFAHPSKFVGPVYDEATAQRLAAAHGWAVRQDGTSWRRVVPSPEPAGIVELDLIRLLIGSGHDRRVRRGRRHPGRARRARPAARRGGGRGQGPDRGAARRVASAPDALLLLTDVPAVMDGYGTPQARPIRRATPAELRARSFPAGSMGPKIEAVCRFVEATGGIAAIGRLDDAAALLDGTAGTLVTGA